MKIWQDKNISRHKPSELYRLCRQTKRDPWNTNLLTIINLCKSKWTMNFSFTYFRNVTLQLVKLYCLKPSKLWRTCDFSLVHPSISQTVKLFSLQFLSSLFFFNLWHVVPRFPSLNVHLFLPDKSGSVLSSKSYPSIKWFMVREPVFASLYSLYCFHVSKTKKNKSKVEEKCIFKNCR